MHIRKPSLIFGSILEHNIKFTHHFVNIRINLISPLQKRQNSLHTILNVAQRRNSIFQPQTRASAEHNHRLLISFHLSVVVAVYLVEKTVKS